MSLTNFGEQFAAKVYRRTWQNAVTPAITNSRYEGELKKAGDRVTILTFLNDIVMGDYVVGTDMSLETIVDDEDSLVVEKRKFYNFPMDRLETLFTYADDVTDALTENASKTLERLIDTYVLEQAAFARAGSWVGIDVRVPGSGTTGGTMASITTSAAGGTVTLQTGQNTQLGGTSVEQGDGTLAFSGFTTADIGKPIRLTSGLTYATEWYRITAVNSTVSADIENWDGATSGSDIPTGDTLRGLRGSMEYTGGVKIGPESTTLGPTAGGNGEQGWGWEFQAAIATSISDSNVYDQIVELAERLSRNEIPDTDRHITGPTQFSAVLKKASELQPAISMAYEGVVLNGKVGRVSGFDIHEAAGVRVSTRAGHATSTGVDTDAVATATAAGYQILANHISFCTFAFKWSESRVVDAENQFSKKYQGLNLYGAKVTKLGRKSGALLFGTL